MPTQDNNSLAALIASMGLKEGNQVLDSNGNTATTGNVSVPLYADSSGQLQAGSLPFAFPLAAGATDTSFSAVAITGSATGTANDLMHLNLVAGANATATIGGYYRVTVTDNAGVITSGAYYAPFYVLS